MNRRRRLRVPLVHARGTHRGDLVRHVWRRSGGGVLAIVTVLAVAVAMPRLGGPDSATAAEAAQTDSESSSAKLERQAKLRYEISVKTPEINAGGSVGIEARLYNDGDQPVTVPWDDTAYDDLFCFTITNAEGRLLARPSNRLTPPVATSAKAIKTVPPHGVVSYNIVLSSFGRNCQQWHFRTPGPYTLLASYVNRIDSYIDTETGQAVKIPDAWTGTLEADPIEFVVKRAEAPGPITVAGRVVDAEGKPISGAVVVVNGLRPADDMWGGDIMGRWRETTIDQQLSEADGTFAFESLSDASAAFRIDAQHADHVLASTTVQRKPPKTKYEAKIVMQTGATIRGRVVDPEGRPIVGVSVRSYPADKRPDTDADGRFAIAGVPPDALHLDFWRPGYAMITTAPTPQEAASGEWTVRLIPNSALRFSGVARLADAKPLANRQIEFSLKNAEGRSSSIKAATTDNEGRFEATLDGAGPFHGDVWIKDQTWQVVVSNRFHPELNRRWRAPVADLRPGGEVTLTFANDRAIEVTVEPDGKLPDGMTMAAMLQMGNPPDGRWQQADANTLRDPAGGVLRFEQLSPGDYKVRVFAAENEGLGWEKNITIADTGSQSVTKVVFRLPRLETGSAKLRVVDAAGDPVNNAEGEWCGPSGSSGQFTVRDGAAELSGVLAGTAFMSVQQGPLTGKIAARIEPGKQTDAGTLTLEPIAQDRVRVKGRILYEDGSLAFGAKVAGRTVDKEGAFDAQELDAGPQLVVDLSDALGWLGEGVPSPSYERPLGRNLFTTEAIILPLRTEPRSLVEREIIIDRAHRRTLTVVWRGQSPDEPYFSLSVDRALYSPPEGTPAGSGVDEVPRLTSGYDMPSVYRCSGFAALKPEGQMTLSELADGKGTLFLRADNYIGHASVDEGDQTVVFDRAQSGSIEGRVVRADGSPAGRVRVVVQPKDPPPPGQSMSGAGFATGIAISIGTTTAADGTFRFESVGPGQYTLSTPVFRDQPGQTVEVRTGQTSRSEFESAANPDGPPPLRL